jgi:hypothetical protein
MTKAGNTIEIRRPGHDLPGIALRDHLMGATGGVERARRLAGSPRSQPPEGALRRLAADVHVRAAVLAVGTGGAVRRVQAAERVVGTGGAVRRVQAAERVVSTGGAVRAS